MKRVRKENINTPAYWNETFVREAAEARPGRVDNRRLGALLRWMRIREEELQRPVSVLDAGCGPGDVTRFLLAGYRRDVDVVGVDISKEAVEICKKRFPKKEWRVADLSGRLPYDHDRFDLTFCGETLEHLDDPDRAVRELARVTAEGGFLVLTVPYRGRNRSNEHVWEFEPGDFAIWGAEHGELVFLDCRMLLGWLSIVVVIRRLHWGDPS